MNNKKKIGILLTTLILPICIFLVLKLYGTNRYATGIISNEKLKQRRPEGINCTLNSVDGVHRIPDFSFSSEQKQITQEYFKNKIYIASFLYAEYPELCRQISNQLLRIQEFFKHDTHLKILSHIVKPDTLAFTQNYAEEFYADSTKWVFVTGDKNTFYDIASCGYFVDFQNDDLILIDEEKCIRGFYKGTNREDVDRLITEITILLQE